MKLAARDINWKAHNGLVDMSCIYITYYFHGEKKGGTNGDK